ncbi:MAG: GNAT family N-acetyltransferase [Anaerolineae bacterium]|nr:GNAT family N-acetyltransferase [Anaerolineae bacterium]
MLAQMKQTARANNWLSWLTGPILDTSGFVFAKGDHVVGNLSLRYAWPGGSQGRLIGNVVVHPDHRRQGIARAMMDMAITTAREQDARWIGLEVREDNEAARALYEQLGFVEVGRVQHLLRPEGIPWPSFEAGPHLSWSSCVPSDAYKWVELACKIYDRRQSQVLEIRPSAFAFGGLGQYFSRWFGGQLEWAWLHGNSTAHIALRIKIERRYHFHLWDMLLHPDDGATEARASVNKALRTVQRFPSWPVVAMVADQPVLLDALYAIGFECRRTQIQMVFDL